MSTAAVRRGHCEPATSARRWRPGEPRDCRVTTAREIAGRSRRPFTSDRYAERSELAAFLRFIWRRADALPVGVQLRFARVLVLLIRLAAHTGSRPGTLVSAWWSDFDPTAGTITLPPDRHKTGLPLVIYLPPILVHALARERDRPGRHTVSIFTHERGKGGERLGHSLTGGVPWGKLLLIPLFGEGC